MNQPGHKKGILLFVFSLLAIAFMIFFNDVSTHVHLKELKILIQKNNAEKSNHNHISLIMNYKVNQKLYSKEMEQSEADFNEIKSNLIFLSELKAPRVEMDKYRLISAPVIQMVNGIRFFMGKEPIRDLIEDKVGDYLSLAYYYERNKQYAMALEVYKQALNESRNDRAKQSAILLHQGYCHAMTGETQRAREKYRAVIRNNLKDDIMLTAMVLLKYLDGFEQEVKKILAKEPRSIETGEKLYQLLAYGESLRILNEMENKAAPSLKARINYLKGRSHEELGQKESALLAYQSVIVQDRNSPYAKAANSRIFIMGAREIGGKKIKELALTNNGSLKDGNFTKMVLEYQSLDKEASEFESRLKENTLYPTIQKQLAENIALNDRILEKNKLASLREEKRISPPTQVQIQPKSSKRIQVRVETVKGDIFTGEIAHETEHVLILKTLIGEVKIRKIEIKSRRNLN